MTFGESADPDMRMARWNKAPIDGELKIESLQNLITPKIVYRVTGYRVKSLIG